MAGEAGCAVANEYADLADLKAFRGILPAVTAEDAALTNALTAASRALDRKTGRRFWLDDEPSARTLNPRSRVVSDPDGERLLVPDIGTSGALLVETGSGLTWTAVTDYETGPEDALDGWPITSLFLPYGTWGASAGRQRIRITAPWGWPAIPDDIQQATLILANRYYMRKDTPEGVKGSADWGAIRLSRWDPDVESLIAPYVLPGFA